MCSIPNRRWRRLCDSDKIMSEASQYHRRKLSYANTDNFPLASLSVQEYMRRGYKWSPEHRSSPIGLHLSIGSSVTTLDTRVTQLLTGTLYLSTWDTCAYLLLYGLPLLIPCASTASVLATRLRQHFHTFAGNSVVALTSPGSFRLSWTQSCLIARPFPTYLSSRTFLI